MFFGCKSRARNVTLTRPYVKLPHDVTHASWRYFMRRAEIFARGRGEGALFGRYARLVGAPNYAPSICSVAGLLLALALQSGLRGHPRLSLHRVFRLRPGSAGALSCVRRLGNRPRVIGSAGEVTLPFRRAGTPFSFSGYLEGSRRGRGEGDLSERPRIPATEQSEGA